MKHPSAASIRMLLEALCKARVEFIVIGGAAATLHGSGTTTEDLDIVPASTPENIDRLLLLLADLDAEFRYDFANRHLRPQRSHLEAGGQLLLSTRLGPLDLLMRLHDGRDYDALRSQSQTFTDDSIDIDVIRLPALIEIKRQARTRQGQSSAADTCRTPAASRPQLGTNLPPTARRRKPRTGRGGTRGKLAAADSPVVDDPVPDGGQDGGTPSAG